MTQNVTDREPAEEPLAELERQLISAYVAGAGEDLDSLRARTDDKAREILAAASSFASQRLSEVEARSHWVRTLHGER